MAIILRESAACPASLAAMIMVIYAVLKAVVIFRQAKKYPAVGRKSEEGG